MKRDVLGLPICLALVAACLALLVPPLALANVGGDEFRANQTAVGADPTVAVARDGSFVVVWSGALAGQQNASIWARRFSSAGAPLGSDFLVSQNPGAADVPSVALDDAGNFAIAWYAERNSPPVGASANLEVLYRLFDSSGAPRTNALEVSSSTNDQRNPVIAMNGAGHFVIAWSEMFNNPENGVPMFRVFNASGAAVNNAVAAGTTLGTAQSVGAAMDHLGSFVLVWQTEVENQANSNDVRARRFDSSGTAVGNEFTANTYVTDDQSSPSVAMDPAGDFVITWMSNGQDDPGNTDYGVYAQRYSASGTPQGNEFLVNTFTYLSQWYPRIAIDDNGDFVIVWESVGETNGIHFNVYGQRFNSTGTPVGEQFGLNDPAPGDATVPAVSMSPNGEFVAVWDSTSTGNGEVSARCVTAACTPTSSTPPPPSGQGSGGGAFDSIGLGLVALAASRFRRRRLSLAVKPRHRELETQIWT